MGFTSQISIEVVIAVVAVKSVHKAKQLFGIRRKTESHRLFGKNLNASDSVASDSIFEKRHLSNALPVHYLLPL